jgi:drug/metabolite transporter (DMT)-like permease
MTGPRRDRRFAAPPRQAAERTALLLAALVVLFWGTAATAFEIALRSITPYRLLVWSSAVSLLVLAAALALTGRWRSLRGMHRRDIARALLLGTLNPFLYYLVLFAAYDRLPGQVALSLN